MHRCLQIHETLDVILEHAYHARCSEHTGSYSGTRTLIAVALTCRSFLEPALDRLWETQLSLVPLTETLPADAWRTFGNGIVTLARPLHPGDWARFNTYAARIKSLGYSVHTSEVQPEFTQLNLAVLDAFIQHHQGLPLLPNLRRLRWNSDRIKPVTLHYADLFLVPSLTTLHLDFTYHWRETEEQFFVSEILGHIQRQCPYVASILVDHIPFDPFSFQQFRDWTKSRQVYVPGQLKHDIARIASLCYLREIQLWIRSIEDLPSSSDVLSGSAFPFLRVLRCYVRSLDIAHALLRLVRSCQLEVLAVGMERRPSRHQIQDFLSELKENGCITSLREIRLFDITETLPRALQTSSIDPSDFVVGADVLAPLLSFSNLRTVEVNFSTTYNLDTKAVIDMATAWPDLEHLQLGVLHGWSARSAVAFSALKALVTSCPRLESCGLAVDLSVESIASLGLYASRGGKLDDTWCLEPAFRLASSANRRVTCLHMADSQYVGVNPSTVGACLAYLFLNLREIRAHQPDMDPPSVEQYVLSAMRKDSFWRAVLLEARSVLGSHPRI